MSLSPSVLYTGGQLTTSAASLVTGGVNAKTLVTDWAFTNTDTVARALTVYVVRSGGTAGLANVLVDARALAAGETYQLPMRPTLAPGDTIQAKADAAAVVTCAGISGWIVTGT